MITSALMAKLDTGVSEFIYMLRFDVAGYSFGYNHTDRDIPFGGIVYSANPGIETSQWTLFSTGNGSMNVEIETIAQSAKMDQWWYEREIIEQATVSFFLYDETTGDTITINEGVVSKTTFTGDALKIEIRSFIDRAKNNNMLKFYSSTDRANLGDPENGLNASDWTFSAKVVAVSSNSRHAVFVQLSAPPPALSALPTESGWFDHGIMIAKTGQNAYRTELKRGIRRSTYLTATSQWYLEFFNSFPENFSVGDEVLVITGYDGSYDQSLNKFNNVVNFRGEPFIPKRDNVSGWIV